jgi:UMF1 family MFS transporter
MAQTNKKGAWGWMFFDWASQPFHTLIITFIFGPYFVSVVAENAVDGQAMWGYATGIGALIIAIMSPILGSVADQSGPRKPWIMMFSVLYIIGSMALWMAEPGANNTMLILVFFVIGLFGVEFATVFTNSMLPEIAAKKDIGRISGSGWAMGYWGGLLSLIIVLGFIAPGPGSDKTMLGMAPIFGLSIDSGEPARATGPLTAIWYLVFIIPFFLWVPDKKKSPVKGALAKGLSQLKRTIAALPSNPSLFAYLGSSMMYRDALNGLYAFGGIYAAGVLNWGLFELGVFGIVAALFGAIGAWIGGRVDRKIGPKPVIIFTIWALIIVCIVAISTGPNEVFFMAVEMEIGPFPAHTVAFLLCGAVIGAAGGSLQSASRTMLVRQAEPGRMTEAFGIYALAGKATSFAAPILIGVVTALSDSQRIGVTPVVVLFILGLILMNWVASDPENER